MKKAITFLGIVVYGSYLMLGAAQAVETTTSLADARASAIAEATR